MSLGISAIGELAIGAQAPLAGVTKGKPPHKRVAVAKSDSVAQPEPR